MVNSVSVLFSSVTQLCLTLCDSMNLSTPGLPAHHQLLEFTQTHVHQVGDAIQPSYPLSSPSLPALNPSQHTRAVEKGALSLSVSTREGSSFYLQPQHPVLPPFGPCHPWLGLTPSGVREATDISRTHRQKPDSGPLGGQPRTQHSGLRREEGERGLSHLGLHSVW